MKTLKQIAIETIRAIKIKKPISKTDHRTTQGSYGSPSIIQKSYHGDTGSYSTSGSGYTTRGTPGLSSALGPFDLPDNTAEDKDPQTYMPEDDPPVGVRPPNFGDGGAIKTKHLGTRRK